MDTCTCAVCEKQAPYRFSKVKGPHPEGGEPQSKLLYPPGWGREFCAKYPDDPKLNRILCSDCLLTQKVQRGTVRFVEPRT